LMTKNAPDKDNAQKLMEFLASDEAQMLYAGSNYEYPVNPAVKPSPTVAAWGELKPDPINVADVAKHLKRAAELVAEVDMNN
jgi:iron(III) transport system substrate-binding protein